MGALAEVVLGLEAQVLGAAEVELSAFDGVAVPLEAVLTDGFADEVAGVGDEPLGRLGAGLQGAAAVGAGLIQGGEKSSLPSMGLHCRRPVEQPSHPRCRNRCWSSGRQWHHPWHAYRCRSCSSSCRRRGHSSSIGSRSCRCTSRRRSSCLSRCARQSCRPSCSCRRFPCGAQRRGRLGGCTPCSFWPMNSGTTVSNTGSTPDGGGPQHQQGRTAGD